MSPSRALLNFLVIWAPAAGAFLWSDVPAAAQAPRADRTSGAAAVQGPPIVAQAAGLCERSGTEQFNDVGRDDYGDYGADYILCMRALGLSNGVGGGAFGPDRDLTRGQMASFLARLLRAQLGLTCPGGGTPFTDTAGSVHAESIACL